MIRHYLTLLHLKKELNSIILNNTLIECFTQQKNIAIFEFYDGKTIKYLEYDANATTGALFIRENFHRAKKNSTEILTEIKGSLLNGIELLENDRSWRFYFQDKVLQFFQYGGSRNNIILLDHNVILNAFKHKNKLIGTSYFHSQNSLKNNISEFPDDSTLQEVLCKSNVLFTKYLADELAYRLSINIHIKYNDLTQLEKANVLSEANKIRSECESACKFFVLRHKSKGILFSSIKLNQYSEIVFESDSISQAIAKKVSYDFSENNYERISSEISSILTNTKNRTERKIRSYQNDANLEKSIEYKKYADLLSSQSNPHSLHGNSITVEDWENGESIEILLNERLTLIQNSLAYYQKSKDKYLDSQRKTDIVNKTIRSA